MFIKKSNSNGFSVKAWQGDAKTLLAFNFADGAKAQNLAGFSIQVQPHGQAAYYLFNNLVLPAGTNATVAGEVPNSTANAPIQKFRWLHVPGSFHQGDSVFYGVYTYTVTPRYFDGNKLLTKIDSSLSVSLDIQVTPFATSQVQLGFTRGFTQSQGFTHKFGNKALFHPAGKDLVFDTGGIAGTNAAGQSYTFLQEYQWSGFTARDRVFEILNAVAADSTLTMDVFAYDLNEPDVIKIFFQLAAQGRIRVILDNASLHHPGKPEDAFEQQFNTAAKAPAAVLRGKFGRFAHDKVFIVYKNDKPLKVLTGSTNFSVTGMYVNSNHVLVFNNTDVADLYAQVFNEAWNDKVSESFNKSSLAEAPFPFNQVGLPNMSITFSPHSLNVATHTLNTVVDTIKAATSSVLFAVMDITSGGGPVFPALAAIHQDQNIFSYGISDAPGSGISLYKPGNKTGVLVGGKPGTTILPPPFDQEKAITIGHQVHHKFIVCDFNTDNPVVWCGSSNLALGGEQENGDNLLQIHDADIATVFALEALSLVDHFDFRNANEAPKTTVAAKAIKGSDNTPAAGAPINTAPLFLYDNDSWAKRYFAPADLHNTDRELFG